MTVVVVLVVVVAEDMASGGIVAVVCADVLQIDGHTYSLVSDDFGGKMASANASTIRTRGGVLTRASKGVSPYTTRPKFRLFLRG